ncbi:hypothetical protein ACP70R_035368 [Stipagrostis hirtigluma subsp. patula]
MARPAAAGLERRRFFKVLLPRCLKNLRVPGEIARALGDDGEVLVVGALGRVWRVELRRERGDGEEVAFLARGWAEFVRAHGAGAGWFVVFRHEGRRVLTVKAFDTSLCRRDFCSPRADLTSKNMLARPQFISILFPEFSRKMPIPPRFAQNHVMRDNARKEALFFSSLGKFWRIGLEREQTHIFFSCGWAEFLMAHGISEGHLLLFRYEGNMLFTVKVFAPSGCQKEYDAASSGRIIDEKSPEKKKPEVSSVSRKRRSDGDNAIHAGDKQPERLASVKMKKAHSEPVHLVTKMITACALKRNFAVSRSRCASIGLLTSCTVTLKTSAQSKRSWKVTFRTANTYCYLQSGWKEFCRDNKVREGDQCTINVVERTLWLCRGVTVTVI